MCFYVSADLGDGEHRAWGGPEEGGLAHMLPFHMPGGGPENTTQKMMHGGIIYCTRAVDEALYLKLTLLKQELKILSCVHALVSLLVRGETRIQTQFTGCYVIYFLS